MSEVELDIAPEGVKPIIPVLEVRGVNKVFRGGGSFGAAHMVKAVTDVSFDILPGEAFGLIGESGSGKSTLGRLLLRLEEPTSGQIMLAGDDIAHLAGVKLRKIRAGMQMVFQDPFNALNPSMTIRRALAEPLKIHRKLRGAALEAEIARLLNMVGLSANAQNRLPREFSGGQRQRICLARALALEPKLIVLDEPTSALDVSVQAQIINLLVDLKAELNLTYIFISHDLSVIGQVCDRIGVMRRGELMEITSRDQFIANPQTEYARSLRDAVPEIGRPLPETLAEKAA
jgi:ABC-type glutathione transport system ATPase component